MCGISGFVGSFSKATLESMNDAQAHRGPDDADTLFIEQHQVGLAHRRLAIIDLSANGRQPMWDASQRYCIIFNGEIYNYKDLRRGLIRDGFAFKSDSDTEVLLNLYCRDHINAFTQLNGIYAFAIWDSVRAELVLARDTFGVKPLYYAANDNGFLFASELKAILCERSVDRRIDVAAIASYLTYLWCPAPRTPLLGVKKLEPGCAMIVKSGRIQRHWKFQDLPQVASTRTVDHQSSPEVLAQQVHSAIRIGVQRQMVADVPVGAFLSGGLDSSAVVAFAREFTQQRLQCFTIDFRDAAGNWDGFAADLPFARKVASHLDVDLHTITVGPEMADELPEMVFHLDEPQADLAPLNTLFICRLARQHGIKVLLSGAGGDDLFTGYRRHYAISMEKYWSWLPTTMRRVLASLASNLPNSSTLLRRLAKVLTNADMPSDERLLAYFYWQRPAQALSLLRSDVVNDINSSLISSPMHSVLAGAHSSCSAIDRMLLLECKFFLPDHNLNYTDKMSMAAGVETRVPLLDADIVALADKIPQQYKQRGRTGKWIFKKSMESILPRDVIYRPKTGFGAPLRHWLSGPLAKFVDDQLSPSSIRSVGLFDEFAIAKLIDADRKKQLDAAYPIFAVLATQMWCQKFLGAVTA